MWLKSLGKAKTNIGMILSYAENDIILTSNNFFPFYLQTAQKFRSDAHIMARREREFVSKQSAFYTQNLQSQSVYLYSKCWNGPKILTARS